MPTCTGAWSHVPVAGGCDGVTFTVMVGVLLPELPDLRLVSVESRGAAMQYFTGSKAHNIALRDRAIGLGLKLNEYGLFRLESDSRVASAGEEEVYEALGLAWERVDLDKGELFPAQQLARCLFGGMRNDQQTLGNEGDHARRISAAA